MVKFYIVRHGETMMNKLKLLQGWNDSALTENGIEVAQCLGKGLKDIHFDAAYCSTLKRTYHTAQILLEAKGQPDLPIVKIEGFKEACFGDFEVQPTHQMWEKVIANKNYASEEEKAEALLKKDFSAKDVLDTINAIDKSEMAESYEIVRNRTQKALAKIAEKEMEKGSKNILIIAHGMSILGMLESLATKNIAKTHIQNASVSEVCYDNKKFEVISMGDMSYIELGLKTEK